MDQTISSVSGNVNQIVNPSFNLKSLIEVVSAIATVFAASAAWFAIRQSNKRLEIEQTPYVVLDHIKRESSRYGFAIKNIGRGPAVHITFSTSDDIFKRNNAFFSNDQPHSANFYPFEESHYWYVDGNVLDNLKHKNDYAYLYVFYSSQFNSPFMTKVKIKRIVKDGNNVAYVVMENRFEELKGKVGI